MVIAAWVGEGCVIRQHGDGALRFYHAGKGPSNSCPIINGGRVDSVESSDW
ncbi:hypothetical protein RMSM_06581 [Rhodopirellula maiorica SM1]|uniref:Uncharacterized protein n=1 Tax=Rhodopirellula maiorica SM1 TaxID=1265738 RepID=M5RM70_9BACT|nr:hypothetical protein RMSM_06581 [Rhodopirellula maiorica SM1]